MTRRGAVCNCLDMRTATPSGRTTYSTNDILPEQIDSPDAPPLIDVEVKYKLGDIVFTFRRRCRAPHAVDVAGKLGRMVVELKRRRDRDFQADAVISAYINEELDIP